MRSLSLAVAFALVTSVAVLSGCGGATGSDTDSLSEAVAYLGTAEDCAKEGKVLVCHVPPGNPANAHTICIGKPAVKAHQRNHGDQLGACGSTDGENPQDPNDPDVDPSDPSSNPDDFNDGIPNTTDPDGGDGTVTQPDDPTTDPTDPGTVPPGTTEPGDATDPGTTDPAEPTCRAETQGCGAATDCCAGLTCAGGTCVPQIN